MWFGTFNGLNRYDGYDFKNYHYSENLDNSLAHNFISDIVTNKDGLIWIGTSDGLNLIDPREDKILTYNAESTGKDKFPDDQIETMLIDTQNRIWIGTRNGGLILYDHIEGFRMLNENLQTRTISLLFEDQRQNIWIIHDNGAIDILNGNDLSVIPLFREKELTPHRISAIVQTPNNEIWLGTQGDGLFLMKYAENTIVTLEHYTSSSSFGLSSNIILSMLYDSMGYLWIGTEDSGIDIYDSANKSMSHYGHDPYDEYSLSHNSIWSIFEDNAGHIWVGTFAHGINLLIDRNTLFKHYQHQVGNPNSLSHNMVNAFLEARDGSIWIATDGGGLNKLDIETNTFVHYNKSNSHLDTDVILSLYEDDKGRLWIGTWANGLYQFDESTSDFIHYSQESTGLASDNILDISGDGQGGLWLGTFWRGLTHYKPDSGKIRIYNTDNSGLSDNNVRVLMRDHLGRLWVGTDVGLDRLDPEADTFINYRHDDNDPHSISKGFVISLSQTNDHSIWIGTGDGLNRYDFENDNFVRFDRNDGLPDNEIKCILEGNDHALWLSTNKGICRFNPENGDVRLFDVSDGLQGNEFNVNSGLRMRNGMILFGGNNGFNLFQPGDIKLNTYIPPIVFTDFKLFNRSLTIGDEDSILTKDINYTDQITLKYNQDVFAFEYSALNYISSQDNQYAYKLEGFENNWNYVGPVRTANYTNIDPGEYVFKVIASNNDGIWNEAGRTLKIHILPPFWRTWWAYLIESLLIIFIVYSILNFIISRQKMKNDLRLEQLELEKMYELDQMKTRFFSNISHEFQAPMTLIVSPLEKLNASDSIDRKSKQSIGMILRNVQRLQRMISQLKDAQKIETGDLTLQLSTGDIIAFLKETVNSFREYAIDHQMQLDFLCDTDREIAWFDADKLDKILYNLLSNAFKYTPDGGYVKVHVGIISPKGDIKTPNEIPHVRHIAISVEDNGIGIPKDKINMITKRFFRVDEDGQGYTEGSGIGLAFVNELVKLYHGLITVKSTEGKGSVFTVHIPLDEKYLDEQQVVSKFIRTPIQRKDFDSLMVPDMTSQDESMGIVPGDAPLVLIVEDDKDIRDYIRDSLRDHYQIITAEDGVKGLDQAKRLIPDLIISDIKMPHMDGIELCNRLKDSEKTSHIPIILLTAYSSKQSKIEGLKKGADAYLAKPFNVDMLNAQIMNLLNSRKQLRKKFSTDFLVGPENMNIKDVDERFLQKVVEVIEKNISDTSLNADSLGKKVGMSRTQLYRKIRGLTDQTVNEFIKNIRLKRAAQLLGEKRVTITEVAYAVGFNDLTYFARCFKKQYQKSPSEYISPPKRK
jgi:signal transduction histidine kinase/ligand-binding sensor domain-containing protein/DNA-binding response OmpR family regulator